MESVEEIEALQKDAKSGLLMKSKVNALSYHLLFLSGYEG